MRMRFAAVLFLTLSALADDPCDDAQTQAEINRCSHEAFLAADAELNATWKQVLKAVDEEPGKPRLIKAQRMWIAFRDEACYAEASVVAGGGSLERTIFSGCRERLTRERVKHLKEILEWRDN